MVLVLQLSLIHNFSLYLKYRGAESKAEPNVVLTLSKHGPAMVPIEYTS